MSTSTEPYVPGTYALETLGDPLVQERKSPPLDDVVPGRAAYRRVDPAPYHDPAFIAREAERLFARTWLCAGPECDVRQPGDWMTFDIAGESYLIVRGKDDQLRAFHNVCQHRGHRLAKEPIGNGTGFVCGFHAWRYSLDGKCTNIPDRKFFAPEALAGSCNLPDVRCETAAGLVFICIDPMAPSLAEHLGPLPEILSAYDIGSMHVVKDCMVDVAANWKLVKHANLEAYHFPKLHPLALPIAEDLRQQIDFYPNGHNRFITTNGDPSSRLPPRKELDEGQKFLLSEAGVDPETFKDGPYGVRRAIQLAKRQPYNAFGLDYSAFSDNQLTDDWSFSLFPNVSMNTHPEGVLFMRYLPHGTDPGRSTFHVMVLAPKMKDGARPPAYMGVEPDADVSGATRPGRTFTTGDAPGLGWALDDDVFAVAEVQKGIRSRGFKTMRLNELEQRVQHFCAEYDSYVRDAG